MNNGSVLEGHVIRASEFHEVTIWNNMRWRASAITTISEAFRTCICFGFEMWQVTFLRSVRMTTLHFRRCPAPYNLSIVCDDKVMQCWCNGIRSVWYELPVEVDVARRSELNAFALFGRISLFRPVLRQSA